MRKRDLIRLLKNGKIDDFNKNRPKNLTLSSSDIKFNRMDLSYIDLEYCTLENISFNECILRNVSFKNSIFNNVYIDDSVLHGSYFNNSIINTSNIINSNFRYTTWSKSKISNSEIFNNNFSNSSMRFLELTDTSCNNNNFMYTILHNAKLTRVYLENTDLTHTILRGAEFTNCDLPKFQICPEQGSFIAYKKLFNINRIPLLCTLEIPSGAKRNCSLVGRKCRSDFAKVLEIKNIQTGKKVKTGYSIHYRKFKYNVGKVVYTPDYDDDIRTDFTGGIHFFITLQEALEYRIPGI